MVPRAYRGASQNVGQRRAVEYETVSTEAKTRVQLRIPRIVVLIAALVVLGAASSWAIDRHLSDPLHSAETLPPPADPQGRSLYILLIDSLAPADVEAMPAVLALRDGAFSATVEPCADNYTDPCTYEALTGRSTFSLFGFLDNMGVLERDKGANLIHDAMTAGWPVAVLSRHDMDDWGAQATVNLRSHENRINEELETGLLAAQDHRLVFHHYVWHDVVSHKYPRGKPAYTRSLDTLNDFVAKLVAGLPPDTDLLITGDHGHLDDGRHLQGLDTPTEVIVRSPRVVAQRVEGRVPITAVRWLSALSTGLGTEAGRVSPDWRDWAADSVSTAVRASGAPPERDPTHTTSPLWGILTALALGAASSLALGPRVGLLVSAWGLLVGWAYPSLHEANLDNHGPRAFLDFLPLLPIASAIAVYVRMRKMNAIQRPVVWTSLALGLLLFPVRGSEGVLRNIELILIPGVVAAALPLLPRLRTAPWRERALPIALLGVAAALVAWLDFRANDVRLISLPWEPQLRGHSTVAALGAALGAGALQARVLRHPAPIAAAIALVLLAPQLPGAVRLVAFIGALVALVSRSQRVRAWAWVPLLSVCTATMFKPAFQFGILTTAALLSWATYGVQRANQSTRERDAYAWLQAIVLAFGAYAGLAWTLKLAIEGIDFGFMLDWIPEGSHETLWWVLFAGVVIKSFLPLFFLDVGLFPQFNDERQTALGRATGIAGLRFVVTMLFATGWVTAQGSSAATRRLLRTLQDGYGWLILAVVLAALWALRPRHTQETPQGVVPMSSGASARRE